MNRSLLSIAILPALLTPSVARAELLRFDLGTPDSPETAILIAEPLKKHRFFTRLSSEYEVDYFSMTVDEGTPLTIALETPVSDGDFRPIITLFGPGLGKPSEDPVIEIGETNGAIIARPNDEREKRFDQFLFTTFHIGPRITVHAPRTATYGIAVRNPLGGTGRYVLHVGSDNQFTWADAWQGIVGTLKGVLRLY